jgi:glycosyltransferase involved in cell wall biosynthesis
LALIGDGPLRDELNDRIQKLGLAARARLLRAKPLAELPGLMNALDVLVLPSRTTARWKEQFGRVIIEAHACGVPVIGSDSGAIPDVIGEGGIVVPEADANSLATAIKALNFDRAAASRMGRSGHSQVKAHYTWDQIAARMHRIYQRVMAPLPGGTRPVEANRARTMAQ